MEVKSNPDTERTSTPYPEYITTLAAVINQYGRGEISVYEWVAYLDGWWDASEYRNTFEKDGGLKAVYLCALHVEDQPIQIIQHSEENDRRAYEYLLQRHPNPQWWKDMNS